MSADEKAQPQDEAAISAEALKKAEHFVEEEEGAHNRYAGVLAVLLTLAAVAMSVFRERLQRVAPDLTLPF